jgi:hypothetical protein
MLGGYEAVPCSLTCFPTTSPVLPLDLEGRIDDRDDD